MGFKLAIKSVLAICMGIIGVRFKNHSRHINTARLHKSWASLFYKVPPNTSGKTVEKFSHVNYPAKRIFYIPVKFAVL